MDDNAFREFIDEIKAKADLVTIIESSGAEFAIAKRGGRYLHGQKHNSLVIDQETQTYHWNSHSERGDVFTWIEKRHGGEFFEIAKDLARKVGVRVPDAAATVTPASLAFRAQVEFFDLVARWTETQLTATPAALAYATGRGWTADTIAKARLGFTAPDKRRDLLAELKLYGHDPESPAAVAILGYQGDVRGWAKAHNVDLSDHSNWLEKGRIWGLLDFPRLVYPHLEGSKVVYFSGRNLKWEGEKLVGEKENKSWNLPKTLCGQRRVFFNHEYRRSGQSLIIVEGPADAITLGQWGQPALASMGVAFTDFEQLLTTLTERHERLYVGVDDDKAGTKALQGEADDWPLAFALGPLSRVIHWGRKDANDWLQAMISEGLDPDQQRTEFAKRLGNAATFAEVVAAWAGMKKGADKDDAQDIAFRLILDIPKIKRSQYRKTLADLLGFSVREFDNILKDLAAGVKKEEGEPIETLGGIYKDESGDPWLVEYIYNPEKDEANLVYRDPSGKVGTAPYDGLLINGNRYIPRHVTDFVRRGGVLLPSELGRPKATRDLINIVEAFISAYYLLDEPFYARIMAYYVLLTWIYDAFEAIPYLRAKGDYGSGKSELMKRVGFLCYRLLMASGANSDATFFRMMEEWKGTLFVDEADLGDGGDMSNLLVKFLNLGAMRGNLISRMVENISGTGAKWELGSFDTFGPKLIAMRGEFKDRAVASRTITFELMGKEMIELKMRGVPLVIDGQFRADATSIRNMLLRWRMDNWQPTIAVTEDLLDVEVSARINQVTAPVKALAKDDADLQKEIERFMRVFYQQTVLERSMSLPARVVEALWNIYTQGHLRTQYVQQTSEGEEYMLIGHVAKIANQIVDEMNRLAEEEEGPTDDKKRNKKGDSLTPRGVGSIIKNTLQLPTGNRRGDGFPVFWDPLKMKILVRKYGIAEIGLDDDIIIHTNGHKAEQNALFA